MITYVYTYDMYFLFVRLPPSFPGSDCPHHRELHAVGAEHALEDAVHDRRGGGASRATSPFRDGQGGLNGFRGGILGTLRSETQHKSLRGLT